MKKRLERDYFYLTGNEQLGDIIDIIRKAKSKENVLVVPPDSAVLSHPVHIEVLAEEIKKSNKEIFISTDDLRIIDLSRHYGIPLFLEEYKHPQISENLVKDLQPSSKEKPKKPKKPKLKLSFNLLKPVLGLLIIFLIGVIVITTFQTKVTIDIALAREKINFSEVVQTDDDALRVDIDKLLLPASVVEVKVAHTSSIETTGQKILSDNRPMGLIEIQNYNQVSLPLVVGTRFIYADKVYRISEKITVPSKSGNEPGKAVVEVIGDRNYDEVIEPGTSFLIPGLKGTLWEPLVKAVAKTQIKSTGGKVKVVNPEDITNVRLSLEKEIKEILQSELATKYPDSFYSIDGGIFTLNLINVSHKVGAITDRISATGEAKLQTVAIKKEDLFSLIKGLVAKEADKKVEKIDISEIEVLDLNLAKNTSVLNVKANVTLVPVVNIESLKESVKGKKLQEVKEIFTNDDRIAKAEIEIFPNWRTSLPGDAARIQIRIK